MSGGTGIADLLLPPTNAVGVAMTIDRRSLLGASGLAMLPGIWAPAKAQAPVAECVLR